MVTWNHGSSMDVNRRFFLKENFPSKFPGKWFSKNPWGWVGAKKKAPKTTTQPLIYIHLFYCNSWVIFFGGSYFFFGSRSQQGTTTGLQEEKTGSRSWSAWRLQGHHFPVVVPSNVAFRQAPTKNVRGAFWYESNTQW